MIEHEKKFKLTDPTKIKGAAISLGFKFANKSCQKDTYFTRPDVDFMHTKECLRIRTGVKHTEITYKPATTARMKSSQSIWKKEINLTVDSDSLARDFLLAIGSIELCVVEKTRQEFKKGNVTLAFDHIAGLGDFIEIEMIAAKKSQSLIDRIDRTAEELGLVPLNIVDLPYRDLVMNQQQ